MIEKSIQDLPAKNEVSKFCQALDFNTKTRGVKMSVCKTTGSKVRPKRPFKKYINTYQKTI